MAKSKIKNIFKGNAEKENASSTEEEQRIEEKPRQPKRNGKAKSRGGKRGHPGKQKSSRGKESKDSTQLPAGTSLTPIVCQAYMAYGYDKIPEDMTTVTIDEFAFVCQLYERIRGPLLQTSNQTVINEAMLRFKSGLYALIQQITYGVRYADLPQEFVAKFTRNLIYVCEADIDLLHVCCIPKGRVYIKRANKSIAALAALLQALPDSASTLQDFDNPVKNYTDTKGVSKFLIMADGQTEAELDESLRLEHDAVSVDFSALNQQLWLLSHAINAAFIDKQGFKLYTPMLCDLTDVCYIQAGTDLKLITFQQIKDEDVKRRLLLNAASLRFFIHFRRCYRDPALIIETQEISKVLDDAQRLHVTEKYGVVSVETRKRMKPTGSEERGGMELEEEEVSEYTPPTMQEFPAFINQETGLQFNIDKSHGFRQVLAKNKCFITRAEMLRLKGVKRVCFGAFAGSILVQSGKGKVLCALLIATRERTEHGASVKWLELKGFYANEEFSEWKSPSRWESWSNIVSIIPYTEEERLIAQSKGSPLM